MGDGGLGREEQGSREDDCQENGTDSISNGVGHDRRRMLSATDPSLVNDV